MPILPLPQINPTDVLNEGRQTINANVEVIRLGINAVETTANSALTTANQVQQDVNTLVPSDISGLLVGGLINPALLPPSGGGVTFPLAASSGTSGAPSYSFSGDTGTGVYRSGVSELSFATNSFQRVLVANQGLGLASSGTANSPVVFRSNDTDTGIYFSGSNEVSISTGGSQRVVVNSSGITASITYNNTVSGLAATDVKAALDEIQGNVEALDISGVSFPLLASLGDASTPSYSFTDDANTGIFSPGADQVAITTGGTQRALFSSAGMTGTVVYDPTESGLEATTVKDALDELADAVGPVPLDINEQSGTSYTLALSDADNLVTLDNESPVTVTIPTNGDEAFAVGSVVALAQLGAGQVLLDPDDGVTLLPTASMALTKIDTDTWIVAGDFSGLAKINAYSTSVSLDIQDDLGTYVMVTDAATITLPDGFPTGWQCAIRNATNSNTVTLAAETTLVVPDDFLPEIINNMSVSVIHVGSDVWHVTGALVEDSAE